MTRFAKSYKTDALYELQVEAVPRLQRRRQFPPLARACVQASLLARAREIVLRATP